MAEFNLTIILIYLIIITYIAMEGYYQEILDNIQGQDKFSPYN
jgi:hypothetical protein